MKKLVFQITGMECPNCAMTLEGIEDRLDGVKFAEASYRRAELVVEFDETRLSVEQIQAEIVRLGYGVKVA